MHTIVPVGIYISTLLFMLSCSQPQTPNLNPLPHKNIKYQISSSPELSLFTLYFLLFPPPLLLLFLALYFIFIFIIFKRDGENILEKGGAKGVKLHGR